MYLTIIKERNAPDDFSERLQLANSIAKARKKYGNLSNEQNVHRMVCHMFSGSEGTKRENEHLLYRKVSPSGSILYIQSDNEVDKCNVEKLGYRIVQQLNLNSLINTSVENGSYVLLNAKWAPTKTVNGKKISIIDGDERIQWVKRKAEEAGFEIHDLNETGTDHIRFDHNLKYFNRNKAAYINAFTYHMFAKVTDVEKFCNAIQNGVGRGRAYGCGMTLFKPVYIEE